MVAGCVQPCASAASLRSYTFESHLRGYGEESRYVKDRGFSGSRCPSLTAPPLPVAGCLKLRIDGLALCCCWCTCGFRHCRVGWRSMTTVKFPAATVAAVTAVTAAEVTAVTVAAVTLPAVIRVLRSSPRRLDLVKP